MLRGALLVLLAGEFRLAGQWAHGWSRSDASVAIGWKADIARTSIIVANDTCREMALEFRLLLLPIDDDAHGKFVTAAGVLRQPLRRSLERLDERLRREGLCEIGEASRLKRSHLDGRVVVPSDVDDRHGNSSSFETMPQLDA